VPAAVCARCGDVVVEPLIVAAISRRLRSAFYLPGHLDLLAD